jgi:Zn-dependent protease with chaperone function
MSAEKLRGAPAAALGRLKAFGPGRLALLAGLAFGNAFAAAWLLYAVFGLPSRAAWGCGWAWAAALAALAASPAGEALFRRMHGLRRPAPGEAERLEAAAAQVREALGAEFALFLAPPGAAAFAAGRRTVAAGPELAEMEKWEAAGVLAHEAAHLKRGDGLFLALAWGLGLAGWAALAALEAALKAGLRLARLAPGLGLIAWPVAFMLWAPAAGAKRGLEAALRLGVLAAMRRAEFEADAAAARAGFGGGLLSALAKLTAARAEPRGLQRLFVAVMATHPPADERMRRLMKFLNTEVKKGDAEADPS